MYRLAAFFGSVLTGVVALLTSWLGKKAAIAVALVAAYGAALTALWAGISLLIGNLAGLIPQNAYTNSMWVGMNLVIPDNFEVCVSAMLAADVAVYLYRFNTTKIIPALSSG